MYRIGSWVVLATMGDSMKEKLLRISVLVFFGLAPVPASADPLEGVISGAAREGLPVSALRSKVQEGKAKRQSQNN